MSLCWSFATMTPIRATFIYKTVYIFFLGDAANLRWMSNIGAFLFLQSIIRPMAQMKKDVLSATLAKYIDQYIQFIVSYWDHMASHWFIWYLTDCWTGSYYLERHWLVDNWILMNKLHRNLDEKKIVFILKCAFQNIICRMLAILSKSKDVKCCH